MIKRFFSLFFFGALPVFSSAYQLPQMIDCGTFPTIDNYTSDNYDAWNLGYVAFNDAPEITPIFVFLKHTYHINTVVETGTFKGNTSALFGLLFDEVHTIENNLDFYATSNQKLKNFSNIHCHLGSSEKVLENLLPSLQDKTVLFYLDAHWEAFWPLLNEIEEIGKTHKDNCIIVIDDFKVPGRAEIPYDGYGPHECSFDYIKDQLDRVFTSYTIHYLIPRSIYSRAKFIAIPDQFKRISEK